MFVDSKLEFCDAVDVSAAAGTALAGDVLDINETQMGGHSPSMYLVINTAVDFASAGAATVQFSLATDAQEAIATDGSATVHWTSSALDYSALVTTAQPLIIPLPMGLPTAERYWGILVTTATATTTAGSVNAFLTDTPHHTQSFPDGVN